jgi:hypothetical protein
LFHIPALVPPDSIAGIFWIQHKIVRVLDRAAALAAHKTVFVWCMIHHGYLTLVQQHCYRPKPLASKVSSNLDVLDCLTSTIHLADKQQHCAISSLLLPQLLPMIIIIIIMIIK